MMRVGDPAGVCDCGEVLEYVECEPGHVRAEHVARGGRERHEAWVEEAGRRSWLREFVTAMLILAAVVFLVSAISGCTASANRLGGAAAQGAVQYLDSPAAESRIDALGDRLGEAAGRGAARGARAEAGSVTVPWWAWAGVGLLLLGCAAWIVVAIRGAVRGFERAMVRRDLATRDLTSPRPPR